MIRTLRRVLPVLLATTVLSASAQSPYLQTHGFSLSVGGDGQFTKSLTTNPNYGGVYSFPSSANIPTPVAVNNQQQFTTDSAGFITSVEFHPKPWAGVEFNYGFTHYSERFDYSFASTGNTTVTNTSIQQLNVPTDVHEATGAYQFHPHHIPFQPFVNIGGGALDFTPGNAPNQWRGAGLLEVGTDIPSHNKHIGYRIEGRSLYYRAPNFYQPALSTRGWRATVEPSLSVYYKF